MASYYGGFFESLNTPEYIYNNTDQTEYLYYFTSDNSLNFNFEIPDISAIVIGGGGAGGGKSANNIANAGGGGGGGASALFNFNSLVDMSSVFTIGAGGIGQNTPTSGSSTTFFPYLTAGGGTPGSISNKGIGGTISYPYTYSPPYIGGAGGEGGIGNPTFPPQQPDPMTPYNGKTSDWGTHFQSNTPITLPNGETNAILYISNGGGGGGGYGPSKSSPEQSSGGLPGGQNVNVAGSYKPYSFIANGLLSGVGRGITASVWGGGGGGNSGSDKVSNEFGGNGKNGAIVVWFKNPLTLKAITSTTAIDKSVTVDLCGNLYNTNNSSIGYSLTSIPTKGTVSWIGTEGDPGKNQFVYTPNGTISGLDTFTYKTFVSLSSPSPGISTASTTVTVEIIDYPTSYDLSFTNIIENANITFDLSATIVEESLYTSLEYYIVTPPNDGTLLFTTTGTDVSGGKEITYTPNLGYKGTDSFTYYTSYFQSDLNIDISSNISSVFLNTNGIPEAHDLSFNTYRNTSITFDLSGTDDGLFDPNLRYIIDSNPSLGIINFINGNEGEPGVNTVQYTPFFNQYGRDEFNYNVQYDNSYGDLITSDQATVHVDISPYAPPAPVATDPVNCILPPGGCTANVTFRGKIGSQNIGTMTLAQRVSIINKNLRYRGGKFRIINAPVNRYLSRAGAPAGFGSSPQNTFN